MNIYAHLVINTLNTLALMALRNSASYERKGDNIEPAMLRDYD